MAILAVIASGPNNGVAVDSGSSNLFVRSGTSWSQQAKLTASDAAAGDNFGASAATSGAAVVVGSDQDDGAGSAYVFAPEN